MQIIFILTYILLLACLLIKKRELDFIFIFAVTLLLYNSTSLFGLVYEPYNKDFIEVTIGVYVTTCIVFLCTACFVLLPPVRHTQTLAMPQKIKITNISNIYLFIIFILSLIGIVYGLPKLLNATSKEAALEVTNLLMVTLLHTLPIAGFLVSINYKNKAFTFFFLALLLIIFSTGSRSPLVIAFICFIIIMSKNKPIRLITNYKLILLALFSLCFVILGKTLYGFIMLEGISGINTWFHTFSYRNLIVGGEFISNSAILHEVMINNFTVSSDNIAKSLLAISPFPLAWFDFSSSWFNDAFQNELFPGIKYGMAYHPWAEAYSWLGYLGVFIYSTLLLCTLRILWSIYIRCNQELAIIILMLGVTTAFWVHRNSLGSILAYNRNILYPMILIYFIYLFLNVIIPKKALSI